MSFAILVINYQRPRIIKLFGASIKRLRNETGIDFPVVCVSESEDADVCREYNMTHLVYPNSPVTLKWNHGAEYVRTLGVDYMVISGSDDIFSTAALSSLINHMNTGVDFISFNEIYVYDTDGTHRGELVHIASKGIGVGRAIHSRVLDKVNWRPWDYPMPRNWGMDAIVYKNISPYIQTKAVAKGAITDCKSHVNINKFTMFRSNYRGVSRDKSIFYNYLSKEELDILHSIRHTVLPIQFSRVHKRGRTII